MFHHQLLFNHLLKKQKHLENILALKTVHCLPSFIMFCIYILCFICTLSIIPISYLLEFLSPMSVEQISNKTRLANELKYICGSLFSLCQTFHPSSIVRKMSLSRGFCLRRFDIYFIPFQTKMGSEISAEEIKEEEKVEEEVKVEPSKAAEPKHKAVFLTPEEAAVPSKVGDEGLML